MKSERIDREVVACLDWLSAIPLAPQKSKPQGGFTPMTDMIGGGPFQLKVGEWKDDTSMALCLGTSLLEKGFDLHDQITNSN